MRQATLRQASPIKMATRGVGHLNPDPSYATDGKIKVARLRWPNPLGHLEPAQAGPDPVLRQVAQSQAALASGPGLLLSLDPGQHTGLALLQGGRLVRAGCLVADADRAPCPACPSCHGQPCPHVAAQPAQLISTLLSILPELRALDLVVIERPAWWRGNTPNAPALLGLAELAGALCGALLAMGVPVALLVRPAEWKGQRLDKATFSLGILASLTAEERDLLPRGPLTGRYQADALDAVGLALWACGRLGQWQADPATFAGLVDAAPARSRRRKAPAPVQGGLPLFRHASGPGAVHEAP